MNINSKDYQWCYNKMKYWQKKLGMMNYRLSMHFDSIDDTTAGLCETDVIGCTAKITLNNSIYWNNKQELEKVIFHEVCEAMIFSEFGTWMSEIYCDDMVSNKTHLIIRRLENIFFD